MTTLTIPKDGPRIAPLASGTRTFPATEADRVSPYVRTEYDKSIHTWGIPNNLIRTMAWLPRLALTEVDYANSFIFDERVYSQIPSPEDPTKTVLFPEAGFVDRVTKELLINLVSLMNRSRYSITHHTVIGFGTISSVHGRDRAEQMLLRLVDDNGDACFAYRTDLYSDYQLAALNLAVKLRGDAHAVTDGEFTNFRGLCSVEARTQIESSVLSIQDESTSQAYIDAYVNGMLVETTWCIVHFAGLLNKWFTVLKMMDETDVAADGVDFVTAYNQSIPESIKRRNNKLLGEDGWGTR